MEFQHTPIMLSEVVSFMEPERGGVFIDGTLGGGGHSEALLERMPQGSRLYGVDRDEEAILAASARLKGYPGFTAVRGNFFDIRTLLPQEEGRVGGILLDLGVSSYQLDNPARGFSYQADAPLDMRMDASASKSAYDVVNGYGEAELSRLIHAYGEERFASRIARRIVAQREKQPIRGTLELAELIKSAIPAASRREGPHPAKRTFQAIRIEVNDELAGLEQALRDAVAMLESGGRLLVITFHSLEDRIAKLTFRALENPCTCSPKAPVCICGKTPVVKILTRKPAVADAGEVTANPRSRSAKLRACEKI